MSILLYRNTGAAFLAGVQPGPQIGPATTPIGNWESDWAQIVPVTDRLAYLLLYRNTDGAAYLASVRDTGAIGEIDAASRITVWENNWTQIRPLYTNVGQYLLFYRKVDGRAFTMPFLISTGVFDSPATQIGVWEKDWTQIVPFYVNGSQFLLFYRQADGHAFTAPVSTGPNGPLVGTPTQVGAWDKNWTSISTFTAPDPSKPSEGPFGGFANTTYLLLYRQADGTAFVAPIVSGTAIAQGHTIATWEKDWAQVVPFTPIADIR